MIQPQFSDVQPPQERSELHIVLRAVQKRDTAQLHRAFAQWVGHLADNASPHHLAAVHEAIDLSPATFSELVRCLDPFHADNDVASGLRITKGHTQYTGAGSLVDAHGVRDRHRQVLAGLQLLFEIRTPHHGPCIADYEVAMRAAGAAQDLHAARAFWAAIAKAGLQKWRTPQTWNEFIKAFFLTEPLYYQFDRARVAVKAQDLVRNRNPQPMQVVKQLDRLRHAISVLEPEPWSRSPQDESQEVMRELRKRVQYRGYRAHFVRGLSYGREMDEALLCTSIKAFARSSSLSAIKEYILQGHYGIILEGDRDPDPTQITVTGGHDFPADSPLRPTVALLEAIADAYGSMSHIPLAVHLINFLSTRYNIPVPHAVWSSLLHWSYLFSSKPFNTGRKQLGAYPSTAQRPNDVMQIWAAMTSPSQGRVTPTFDDYDIYIKTLLVQRCVVKALHTIEEYAMPHYASLVESYERSLADEILQADALGSHAPLRATRRRQEAETLKDHTHNRIALWFKKLLRVVSENRQLREGPAGRVLVPNLLKHYAYFLPATVKYRTAQGTVTFELSGDESTVDRLEGWRAHWRTTLPAKLAGIYVRGREHDDGVAAGEPGFVWPETRQMRVRDVRPVPKQRLERVVAPPENRDEGGKWWDKLEEQMKL